MRVERIFLDFTGTLACDGKLIAGVAARLRKLARVVPVAVATADTMQAARRALAGLPVDVVIIRTGREKAALLSRGEAATTAAIGNGRNDIPMFRHAGLRVAVISHEGASAELLRDADVIVTDIRDALDLLLKPLRMTATLRP